MLVVIWSNYLELKILEDSSRASGDSRVDQKPLDHFRKWPEDFRRFTLFLQAFKRKVTYIHCLLMQSIHSLCTFHPVLQPQIFWFLGPQLKLSCRATKGTFPLRYLSHWTGFVFVSVIIKRPLKKSGDNYKRASSVWSDPEKWLLKIYGWGAQFSRGNFQLAHARRLRGLLVF